jgi:hypothetical protein
LCQAGIGKERDEALKGGEQTIAGLLPEVHHRYVDFVGGMTTSGETAGAVAGLGDSKRQGSLKRQSNISVATKAHARSTGQDVSARKPRWATPAPTPTKSPNAASVKMDSAAGICVEWMFTI